jgi:hypothetical protein
MSVTSVSVICFFLDYPFYHNVFFNYGYFTSGYVPLEGEPSASSPSPHSANGVATLHIMKQPGSNVPVFRALTVVFQPSVALFLYCSYRVLSVDAAFKYSGRDDKNYIILEGITADQHIFPLAFGFCFGESKDSYDQFWQDVLGYSGPLKDAIDNLGTRINADRNKGIRASVHENLVRGDQERAKIPSCFGSAAVGTKHEGIFALLFCSCLQTASLFHRIAGSIGLCPSQIPAEAFSAQIQHHVPEKSPNQR